MCIGVGQGYAVIIEKCWMQYNLLIDTDTELVQQEEHFAEYKIMINPGEKVSEETIGFKNLLIYDKLLTRHVWSMRVIY
mgnify:CR=1 FL=1